MDWLWTTLIATEAAMTMAYLGLFYFRRDVALRLPALALLQCFGIAGQLGMLASEWPLHSSPAVVSLLGRVLVAGLFASNRDVCLVRARAADVRAAFGEACPRLSLALSEPRPGELHVSGDGVTLVLRLWSAGPFSLVAFRRPPMPGRLSLLHDWFRKRYPGPVPYLRR